MTAAPERETSAPPLLSCRELSKRFAAPSGDGGFVLANDGVDLDLFAGRVHALLGENGAGKSTLMSLLSGWLRPDAGSLALSGRPLELGSPAAAMRAGIGMVHQRFSLVEALTGAENLALADGGSVSARRAEELAERHGLALDSRRRVADMSMGERQRLEILKLLARDARILILDEPTSVLAPAEIGALYASLRALADQGRAVVLITHKLSEIAGAADEVSVLRRGRMIARNIPRDPARTDGWDMAELSRLMVGRVVPAPSQGGAGRALRQRGEPVLVVRGLTGAGQQPAFTDVSFEVARGEILAIVGVAGNGQEALAAVLGGVERPAGGELTVLGRAIGPRQGRELVAYVPEDRHGMATVPGLTLAENMLLSTTGSRGAVFARGAGRASALRAMQAMNVAASGVTALARELSGGNLQKFILARELSKAAPLLIVEQPTQGLDVLAVADVHAAILRAAAGETPAAVLLITGDPAEALALADRVAVLYRGRVAGFVDPAEPDAFGRIGRLMAGLGTESDGVAAADAGGRA
ncbi:MAG TPA: ABC transporter ATP-binding protein [Humidesulfovibrio sp.]|uniref:ABC transporter ATP-binding protein n=1 Tax=Humidesulfovibrio sp. TaxID=2910988 RepID=UPI002BF9A920|nr:ABC transporter ATP-binding protein [Humidesulfovibrio sp.]HWR03813.1 ABC transporter ATP-binding protein [Humidesulfovibrio sp.]